jgi:hypothetical protein
VRPKNIGQPSLTYPSFSSGRGYVTRERGRLFLAGDGSAAVSFATSAVFDAERDLRLRVGGASGSGTVYTGSGAADGDAAGPAGALGFRPSPSSFASAERRSE